MRTSRFLQLCGAFAVALCVSSCSTSGGGGGPLPTGGSRATSAPASELQVSARFGTSTLAHMRRGGNSAQSAVRRTQAVSFASIVFTGTFYPGYAGQTPVTTSLTYNGSSVPSTVTLGFNNVPAVNNAWVVIDAVAYDSSGGQGSHVDLGQLGGLANIGSSPGYVTLNNASTQRLQFALAAMQDGLVSTYDLRNETGLDGDLGTFISNSGIGADPNTGLFTNGSITTLLSDLQSVYNRTLTLTADVGPPSSSTAWIVWNYTDPAELNYVASVSSTFETYAPYDSTVIGWPTVYGNPNSTFGSSALVAPHLPGYGPSPEARSVTAKAFDATSGTVTIAQVYGGALLAGISRITSTAATPPPFYGGSVAIAERAPGNTTSKTISTPNTTIMMGVTDTLFNYFGENPYGFESTPIDSIYATDCTASQQGCQNDSLTFNDFAVMIDLWNPWDLSSTGLQYCVFGSNECFPLSSGAMITTHTPFFDDTTKGSIAMNPAGGATTKVTYTMYANYTITYASGTSGYFSTSTNGSALYFYHNQELAITTSAPVGTAWYLTLNCGSSVYTASANETTAGSVDVTLASVPGFVGCANSGQLDIGYGLPSGAPSSGTFTVGPIMPVLNSSVL